MPNVSRVFIDIDTQRDFLEPSGALFIPGSEAIVANLRRLTQFARAHAIPVFATACAHVPEDPELGVFPPHCMIGSPGQKRIAATAWPGGTVLHPDDQLRSPLPAHLTLEKREYNLFSHPDADRIVQLYNTQHPTFFVYGVATDYCVRACVDGLLERGIHPTLVVDAIWPIDPSQEPELLTDFVSRGARLSLTEIVCQEADSES